MYLQTYILTKGTPTYWPGKCPVVALFVCLTKVLGFPQIRLAGVFTGKYNRMLGGLGIPIIGWDDDSRTAP